MARELRAGISFSDDLAQTILLEVRDQRLELQYIDERERERDADYWFLDNLLSLDRKTLGKISKVSVALDNSSAFLHRFPLDNSLTQVDQNEQIRWELSHYIQDFKPRDYINDMRVMRTHAREQYLDVLVAAVQHQFVFQLQESLAEQNLTLQSVEVSLFAAEQCALSVYPEIKLKDCVLAGISEHRMDVGVLNRGRLAGYRSSRVSGTDEAIRLVKESAEDAAAAFILLHGATTLPDWTKGMRTAFGTRMTILNPFRRMHVASSCESFKTYLGREHHFVACVGSALRT